MYELKCNPGFFFEKKAGAPNSNRVSSTAFWMRPDHLIGTLIDFCITHSDRIGSSIPIKKNWVVDSSYVAKLWGLTVNMVALTVGILDYCLIGGINSALPSTGSEFQLWYDHSRCIALLYCDDVNQHLFCYFHLCHYVSVPFFYMSGDLCILAEPGDFIHSTVKMQWQNFSKFLRASRSYVLQQTKMQWQNQFTVLVNWLFESCWAELLTCDLPTYLHTTWRHLDRAAWTHR